MATISINFNVCKLCDESISPLSGSFVALNRDAFHLECFTKSIEQATREKIVQEAGERAAAIAAKQQDDVMAARERAEDELQAILKKGSLLWTRAERIRLVEARKICVHCSKVRTLNEGFSGAERKHCHKCYMASQYGEQQAAQAAAKSAASIDAAAQVLAGAVVKAPEAKPEEKKQEAQKQDRFALIELE